MNKLIETLHADHQKILETLNSIRSGQGIGSRDTRDRIIEAKSFFMNHLLKEDNELYPELNRAAESDPELKKLLSELDAEIKGVTRACNDFFSRYQDGSRGDNFIADLASLSLMIKARLAKEEEILYKEYEKRR